MSLFQQPVFINLCSSDLERMRTFWTALGADINEEYTAPDMCLCVILTDSTYAMYLTPQHYENFTGGRPGADTLATSAALLALTVGTREEVDRVAETALKAGATEVELTEEIRTEMGQAGMHVREIVDPDGHQWEFCTA